MGHYVVVAFFHAHYKKDSVAGAAHTLKFIEKIILGKGFYSKGVAVDFVIINKIIHIFYNNNVNTAVVVF